MSNFAKKESIEGAFFGAMVADALFLGSHYEYDAHKIYAAYGNKTIYGDAQTITKVARQVMFTHRDVDALAGGEFFARVTHRVINGATPADAIESVAIEMGEGLFSTNL